MPPGAMGAQMVDVRWIGASPSWLALLRGRIEVGRVTLYQPTIVLETDANGVPNWQFRRAPAPPSRQGAPAAGFHLAVGELRIVQGTISYTNPQTGQTLKAERGRGHGIGRLPGRPVLDFRQRHRERRAAVARLQLGRGQAARPCDRVHAQGAERHARLQGHGERGQRRCRGERTPRGGDRGADRLHRRGGARQRPGAAQFRLPRSSAISLSTATSNTRRPDWPSPTSRCRWAARWRPAR